MCKLLLRTSRQKVGTSPPDDLPIPNRFERLPVEFIPQPPSTIPVAGDMLTDITSGPSPDLGSDRFAQRAIRNAESEKGCSDTLSRPSKGKLSIGLLNVNSINDNQFTFVIDLLNKDPCSFAILTELSNETSDTSHLLEKHDRFPILSCPKNRRVGPAIAKYSLHLEGHRCDSWLLALHRTKKAN